MICFKYLNTRCLEVNKINAHMCIIQIIFINLKKSTMKPVRLLLAMAALVIATGTRAQQINRSDICQQIPGLTESQLKKINDLGEAHQKKMDQLRTRFYAETDPAEAASLKTEMNSERNTHYRNVSALLTPEQQEWFDRQCYADTNGRYLRQGSRQGYGRGMGRAAIRDGRYCGRGYGRGNGYGMGRGAGRGGGRGYAYRQL
jgi:hypothetical protein